MVNGVGDSGDLGYWEQSQLSSEYQDVIDTLAEAFPDLTEAEIEQAVYDYLTANQDKDLADLSAADMTSEISKALNISLSAEAASAIKDEWEDLTDTLDIGVSDLVDVLDTYKSTRVSSQREYKVMLWKMMQGELEDESSDDAKATFEANKKMHEQAMDDFIDTTLDAIEAEKTSDIWNSVLKWVGAAVSFVGALASCVTAIVACCTGVGVGAGVALFAAAAIMCTLALGAAASAACDAFGVDYSLGAGTGLLMAKVINAVFQTELDEEQFATWFAFGVQMTLTVAAIALSLGPGLVSAVSSIASAIKEAVGAGVKTVSEAASAIAKAAVKLAMEAAKKALESIVNMLKNNSFDPKAMVTGITNFVNGAAMFAGGVVQMGSGINTINVACTLADLTRIQALLDNISDVRNMEQELVAGILQIILGAMRGSVQEAVNDIMNDLDTMATLGLSKA